MMAGSRWDRRFMRCINFYELGDGAIRHLLFEGLPLEICLMRTCFTKASNVYSFTIFIIQEWAADENFQYKTLEERRCLKFASEYIHEGNFLASAAF